MLHLSTSEVRAALDFVWRLRGTKDIAGFANTVLEGLKILIPCELVSYNEFHADPRALQTRTLPSSALPPQAVAAVVRHFRDHPLLLHQLQTGDGSPRRMTDMKAIRTFRETALFSEVYRPARLQREIGMALPAPAGTVRCVAVHRNGRDFTHRDLALFTLLRPYLSDMQRELDAAGGVRLLSRRERDALALVAHGKTNVEIAAVFNISPRTVQKHLQHAYDKLGVRRRAAAAVLARLGGVQAEEDDTTDPSR